MSRSNIALFWYAGYGPAYSLDMLATSEWLANRDTWKVLTKIHLSKSIQVTGNTHTHTQTDILIYRDAPYYASENIQVVPQSSHRSKTY